MVQGPVPGVCTHSGGVQETRLQTTWRVRRTLTFSTSRKSPRPPTKTPNTRDSLCSLSAWVPALDGPLDCLRCSAGVSPRLLPASGPTAYPGRAVPFTVGQTSRSEGPKPWAALPRPRPPGMSQGCPTGGTRVFQANGVRSLRGHPASRASGRERAGRRPRRRAQPCPDRRGGRPVAGHTPSGRGQHLGAPRPAVDCDERPRQREVGDRLRASP